MARTTPRYVADMLLDASTPEPRRRAALQHVRLIAAGAFDALIAKGGGFVVYDSSGALQRPRSCFLTLEDALGEDAGARCSVCVLLRAAVRRVLLAAGFSPPVDGASVVLAVGAAARRYEQMALAHSPA
jgi:hypothetical protein